MQFAMSTDELKTVIERKDISDLLAHMSQKKYEPSNEDENDKKFLSMCQRLWQADYDCIVLENTDGKLCHTYPSKIFVPQFEIASRKSLMKQSVSFTFPNAKEVTDCKSKVQENNNKNCDLDLQEKCKITEAPKKQLENCDEVDSSGPLPPCKQNPENSKSLKDNIEDPSIILAKSIQSARNARVRNRFPVPALICNGKNICRSSTLSCWTDASVKTYMDSSRYEGEITARESDINLLKKLKISSIVDLMVEKKKQVLNFIAVSSSEKVDKENRYGGFNIYSLPYPGCEFFKKFIENSLSSEALYYDWSQSMNDAELTIPNSNGDVHLSVCKDWASYKEWDLRTLTRRYLKLIASCLSEDSEESGFLIHCISGWDRTPLFISLLRLSLWADGRAHTSLDSTQMLYFTLAYDWFLFGHLFPNRLSSDENILYFCFEFLRVLIKEESSDDNNQREPTSSDSIDTTEKLSEIGTPTSFGSSTSLTSISSNTPYNKASPYKTSQKEDVNWPFSKENGFTFDGMQDGAEYTSNNHPLQTLDMADIHSKVENLSLKHGAPNKSPYKERKLSGNMLRSRKISLVEEGGNLSPNLSSASSSSTSESSKTYKIGNHIRKANGFIKDFASKRPRKNSSAKYNISTESVELESSGDLRRDTSSTSPKPFSASSTMPVPVPSLAGGANRSRHNSSCSSFESWVDLAPSPNISMEEMMLSAGTIREETAPSSLGSDQSIEHFTPRNRKKKLKEVCEIFYKLYGEIPQLNKSKSSTLFSLYS